MKTFHSLLLCLILALSGAVSPLFVAHAVAQEVVTAPDYAEWEKTAERAEDAVSAARASDLALEELRAQLAGWREKFSVAQSANKARIETLESQVAALGPIPDGVPESAEIAARRQTLSETLASVRVPIQTAEEAFTRADGLIRQVDGIIRSRQTDQLLELGPTPLNPVIWAEGFSAIGQTLTGIHSEISGAWASPLQNAQFREKLPLTLFLGLLAAVLLLRGRHWMEVLSLRVQSKNKIAWRWLLGFLISLGQVIVPLLGVFALSEALFSSGLIGLRGSVIVSALPPAGLAFFVARWLGVRMFPRSHTSDPYLNLTPEQKAEGRWFSAGLGLAIGLQLIVVAVVEFENLSPRVLLAFVFPLLVIVAIMTFRLGQLLVKHARNDAAANEQQTYRNRMIRLLGRAVMVVVIVGVVLGLVGYFAAAAQLVFPTAVTLALLAFIQILQRLISEIYALLVGNRDGARESLIPVLFGFVLLFAAAPILALIWGARLATLSEMWNKFLGGVSLGGARISPTVFLTFAVIFVLGYTLTRLIQGTLRNTVLPKTKLDTGGRNAIVSGTGYLGIFLSAIIAITGAGIDLSSLAIVAGALSVGIGFGLQNIVSNFVSGIILLIERPISEGDWIEVGSHSGYVRDISVRSTRIETFDRADVIVPNADLISGVVMNMTKGSLTGRVIVPVGVAYGNDTKRIAAILQEIAEAHPMVILNPPPGVIFQGFGADSLDFEIRAILRDVNWMLSVKSDMNHEIARRFAEEGIEIPFAQRDIWLRNPEVLSGGGKAPDTSKASEHSEASNSPSDAIAEVDFESTDATGEET